MIETLGLALRLDQFSVLPLSLGPMKRIEQIGPGKGATLGARMELAGVNGLDRQKRSAVRASNHESTQLVIVS